MCHASRGHQVQVVTLTTHTHTDKVPVVALALLSLVFWPDPGVIAIRQQIHYYCRYLVRLTLST